MLAAGTRKQWIHVIKLKHLVISFDLQILEQKSVHLIFIVVSTKLLS